MFCPICRTEYREGFTVCSDCQAPLTAELPAGNSAQPFSVLWSGENGVLVDRFLEELERAKIDAFVIPPEVFHRKSAHIWGMGKGSRAGFAVCVKAADFDAAHRVLKGFPEEFAGTPVIAPGPGAADLDQTEFPPDLPLHWDPSTAKVEVWAGEEQRRATFIRDSLHGVGVPTRLSVDAKGFSRLMVRPEDETCGCDIVRQITENAAPESSYSGTLGSLWSDHPVANYSLLWMIALIDLILLALGVFSSTTRFQNASLTAGLLALLTAASNIGQFCMLYQAIRYELYPLRFIIISFLPFSFAWYYHERYAKRLGIRRLPIAARMRMSPPPSA